MTAPLQHYFNMQARLRTSKVKCFKVGLPNMHACLVLHPLGDDPQLIDCCMWKTQARAPVSDQPSAPGSCMAAQNSASATSLAECRMRKRPASGSRPRCARSLSAAEASGLCCAYLGTGLQRLGHKTVAADPLLLCVTFDQILMGPKPHQGLLATCQAISLHH